MSKLSINIGFQIFRKQQYFHITKIIRNASENIQVIMKNFKDINYHQSFIFLQLLENYLTCSLIPDHVNSNKSIVHSVKNGTKSAKEAFSTLYNWLVWEKRNSIHLRLVFWMSNYIRALQFSVWWNPTKFIMRPCSTKFRVSPRESWLGRSVPPGQRGSLFLSLWNILLLVT